MQRINFNLLIRCACGALLLCLVVAASADGNTLDSDPENDVLGPPCAKDVAYREFEKIQADAYLSDGISFRIFLDKKLIDQIEEHTSRNLRDRSGQHNSANRNTIDIPPGFDRQIQSEMANLKIPTCYENPLYYFMIEQYARDIETARRELGLPLPGGAARFGSIASNDINAYTYPSSDGRNGIIAINVQLLRFISQMTQLAVSAVDPVWHQDKPDHAAMLAQGLMAISYNAEAQDNFIETILSLLAGRPGPKIRPLDAASETLAVFFTNSMERFVFGHEYGHLIKGHVSPQRPISSGATGYSEHQVFARTWPQEFEADEVGLQLLTHILARSSGQNPKYSQYYLYSLEAPLFFFDSMEVLDRARFMERYAVMPPEPSDSEKSLVRDCADAMLRSVQKPGCALVNKCAGGTASESEVDWCEHEMLTTHPPAWLRRERLQHLIDNTFMHIPNRPEVKAAAHKGDEMRFSIGLLGQATSAQMLKRIIQETNGN